MGHRPPGAGACSRDPSLVSWAVEPGLGPPHLFPVVTCEGTTPYVLLIPWHGRPARTKEPGDASPCAFRSQPCALRPHVPKGWLIPRTFMGSSLFLVRPHH